jgi:hypothetical protein
MMLPDFLLVRGVLSLVDVGHAGDLQEGLSHGFNAAIDQGAALLDVVEFSVIKDTVDGFTHRPLGNAELFPHLRQRSAALEVSFGHLDFALSWSARFAPRHMVSLFTVLIGQGGGVCLRGLGVGWAGGSSPVVFADLLQTCLYLVTVLHDHATCPLAQWCNLTLFAQF